MDRWATGVFTSIHGGLGAGLDAVRQLGASTVQLHAPTAEHRTPERTAQIKADFEAAAIAITVVFVGFEDEDYSTIDRVEQTVGLVPAGLRSSRLEATLEIADFAHRLGVEAVGMHLGCVPADQVSAGYAAIVETTRRVCDHCRQNGQHFHLETGQETADELLAFIRAVERENLAVNFDPANMVLYGAGEPLEALDTVGAFVRSVHCKDACWERAPGQPWYEDAPLGSGDVNIGAFLRKLKDLGYAGALTIEREFAPDQIADIRVALQLLERLRSEILG